MPCMPMPPIVTGINIFHVLITNRQSMTSYFKLEK